MSTINRKEDEIVALDLQKTRLEQSILGLQQGNLRNSNGSQNDNILTNDVLIQPPTELSFEYTSTKAILDPDDDDTITFLSSHNCM